MYFSSVDTSVTYVHSNEASNVSMKYNTINQKTKKLFISLKKTLKTSVY